MAATPKHGGCRRCGTLDQEVLVSTLTGRLTSEALCDACRAEVIEKGGAGG